MRSRRTRSSRTRRRTRSRRTRKPADAKPADAKPTDGKPAASFTHAGRFGFGSGRVLIASDPRWTRAAAQHRLARHRIDEDSYAEPSPARGRLLRQDPHARRRRARGRRRSFFSGKPEQFFYVRNLYAQSTYGMSSWRARTAATTRTCSTGGRSTIRTRSAAEPVQPAKTTRLAVHVGMQRLENPFQYQVTEATSPFGIGSTGVVSLNRPRWCRRSSSRRCSATEGVLEPEGGDEDGHTARSTRSAPAYGPRVAADRAAFGLGFPRRRAARPLERAERRHLNVWARYAHGLAAYDMLAVPTRSRTTRRRAARTSSRRGERKRAARPVRPGGGLLSLLHRRVGVADEPSTVPEGTAVVRPHVFLGDYFDRGRGEPPGARLRIRGSDQARWQRALRGRVALRAMPYFADGEGFHAPPRGHALSLPNEGARAHYPIEDVRAQYSVQHYLGLGVSGGSTRRAIREPEHGCRDGLRRRFAEELRRSPRPSGTAPVASNVFPVSASQNTPPEEVPAALG